MRILVGCPACRRQFDASVLPPGSTFRCACGTAVPVRPVAARDAAVVRCSSCGASREGGAASCRSCGSDFTLVEQDLNTLCPSCLARIGDRARYCHHCATPIVPEAVAGAETDRRCPACAADGDHRLRSRALGSSGLSALECVRCGGLWLAEEAFRTLGERARKEAAAAGDPPPVPGGGAAPPRVVYRPCPVCGERMNRANYGRRSGVIVDRCREHGTWFDARELDAILRWIREGGEAAAARRELQETKDELSAARFRVEPKAPEDAWRRETARTPDGLDLLAALGRILFPR